MTCEGEVWRVADRLYSAIFLRDIPTYHYRMRETVAPRFRSCRIMHSRVIKQCLLCQDGLICDGSVWDWMICGPCKMTVEERIESWLTGEADLPETIANKIIDFVFAEFD